jgi:hypothetical protein
MNIIANINKWMCINEGMYLFARVRGGTNVCSKKTYMYFCLIELLGVFTCLLARTHVVTHVPRHIFTYVHVNIVMIYTYARVLSSYCWVSVANFPNVLQPYWLIVLPLDFPAFITSLLYEILAARGGIIYRHSYF